MAEIKLTPTDLHNASEFTEFQEQRVKCGWDFTAEHIAAQRQKVDEKLKSLFWISLGADTLRVGHVSLDAYASPPDPELARRDKSIMTIQSFFILEEHRARGLGGRVMDLMEDMATREPYGSPKCEIIAINTMSEACRERNLERWIGLWKSRGMERPEWSFWSKEKWYAKRGYVGWKEEVRYFDQFSEATAPTLEAVFMRKVLK